MGKRKMTEHEKDLGTVRGIILKYMSIEGVTYKELGIPRSTWDTKMRNPDGFKRSELHRICRRLNIPDAEKAMLI